MAIERHEIFGCEIARNGYRQREHKGIPVGCKRLAWIADIRNARHVGGENRHADHPARNGVTCGSELIRRTALLEERTAEDHHAEGEDDEDDKIYDVHCIYAP